VQNEVNNRSSASEFDFPPGVTINGVEEPKRLIGKHIDQLLGPVTFTADFVDRSENYFVGDDAGRFRSSGSPEYNRWDIDHRISLHTSLYRGQGVEFLEEKPDANGDQRADLYAGDTTGDFTQGIIDSVVARFRDALEELTGNVSLEVRNDGGADIAVFSIDATSSPLVESIDQMEIAIAETGVIRRFDVVYEANRETAVEATYKREYHYRIDLGTDPPPAIAGPPERAQQLPTFGVEWRDEGHVMELTNTGGGPVVGNDFWVSNLAATNESISYDPPFAPGETRYLYDKDGLVLADTAPDNTATVLRGDSPPVFTCRTLDSNGSVQIQYSTDCDGLDCA
jgi:hypothetical protein